MKRLLYAAVLFVVCACPLLAQANAEKELIALEHAWVTAGKNHDVAFIDKLYADEWQVIDTEGNVITKAQDMERVKDPDTRVLSGKVHDMKVLVQGSSAVVTGKNTSTIVTKGKKRTSTIWFTDAFVHRDGRWQCVASQVNLIKK